MADDIVNILLVDDRPNNLVALEAVISMPGYQIIWATSGVEALSILQEQEVAVIITDVMMPTMDGFEFVARVKQDARLRTIPVIFLTAMASEVADRCRGYEVGAVDYLQKPLEPEFVKAKVAVFVELFRQRRVIERQAEALVANERLAQDYRVKAHKRQASLERKRSKAYLRDIEAKKKIELLQSTQLQVTEIMTDSAPVAEAIERVLATVARGLNWDWAALWIVGKGPAPSLRPFATHHDGAAKLATFDAACRKLVFAPGEGLLGRTWMLDRPEWVPEVASAPGFRRAELAAACDLRSAVAVPVKLDGELFGVVELMSHTLQAEDPQNLVAMADIGSRIGLYLQRRRAEETLRESEERFRMLVAGVNDYAIYLVDADGFVTTWNAGAQHIKGYEADEIIGKHFSCFYTATARAEGRPAAELTLAREQGQCETEELMIRKDGSTFWASALTTSVYDGSGVLKGFAKITRDISERKRAEEALRNVNAELEQRVANRTAEVRRREAQLRLITNAMPVLVAELDLDRRFLFVNDAFRQWFAVGDVAVLGKTLHETAGEQIHAEIEPYLVEALSGKKVSFERETTRSGVKHYLGVAAIPEFDEDGHVSGLVLVGTDITKHKNIESELKRAKAAADAASQAKSAFLANMSHEIRTPLGAVVGFADLLVNTDISAAERAKYSDVMKRNGDLLSNLINEILDLSKVEAGKLEVELEDIPLVEVLNDVTTLLNLQAAEKGIALGIAVADDVPGMIRTDPLRLRQILINIIGNAIKFTDKGAVAVKVAEVATKTSVSKVAFAVTDTGPGIRPDEALRLFEPFTQADASSKRKHGGTGLGLVLARSLAQILGGDVVLTESRPGEGSTFTITIDHGQLGPSLAVVPPPVLTPKNAEIRLEGASILLVDDAADNRMLVGRFLRMAGAKVDTAENGREALDKIHQTRYDAVLMDLQMPVMDGYEATSELRRTGYQTPIIALTAHAMADERQRCLAHGFDDHLCKPIKRVMLLERLAEQTGLGIVKE